MGYSGRQESSPSMSFHNLLQRPSSDSPPASAAEIIASLAKAPPPGLSASPTSLMDPPANMDLIVSQLREFRDVDRRREELVFEYARRNQELAALYQQKCNDYEQERKSLAMWQRENLNLEARFNDLKLANESNPLVFVIIDGDGALFRDDLLARGGEGGTDAAFELLAQIRKHVKATYPDASVEDWTIMVQVVVNLEGLARTLHASGLLNDGHKDLTAFAHAFGQAQSLFSFIDVGSGKERADHKIRETLRVMARLSQCKHVMFGPCHDNGYLPVLEPYKRDPIVGHKLSLLETTPATPGFVQLSLNRVKFPSVFRSEPITRPQFAPPMNSMPLMRNGSIPIMNKPQSMMPPMMSPPQSSAGPIVDTTNGAAPLHPLPPPKVASAPPQPASAPAPVQPQPTNSSYAAVGKAPVTAPRTIDIAPKKPPPQVKYYYVNASSERVDEELPRAMAMAEKRYMEKKTANQRNFCNSYHLLGYCEDDDYCKYEHGDRLSPQELLVQKHRARGTYCDSGIACEDFDCYYSHHCRFGRDCGMGHKCKFNDTHHMDLRKVAKIFDDGTKEMLT